MKFHAKLLFVLMLFGAAFAVADEPWTEDDFTEVSNPASPHVAYAIRQNESGVALLIDVAPLESGVPGKVDVGISAGKALILHSNQAQVIRKGEITRYAFVIPAAALVTTPADWERTRLAISVAWPGGPFGMDRQRERFLHCDGGATSAPLSVNPADWAPLDLKERAAAVFSLKKRIFVDFEQPIDGKVTIVIEDAQGRRIRNLVSGQPMKKGPHRIEWDGTDEQGNIVTAGAYRWRAVSHPGITPQYLFSFYNQGKPPYRNGSPSSNWLSDHANAVAATTYEDRVYLGAPFSESGHAIVQLTLAGEKTGHVSFPTLVGIGKLFMAADADCVYAIMEGSPAYEPYQELPDGKWTFRRPLNILRWKAEDGTPKPYDGERGEKVLALNLYTGSGPQPAKGKRLPAPDNLAGAALYNGKIFVSLKQEDKILVVSVMDGKTLGETKLKNPGLIASDGKGLIIAFSGDTLMRIDPKTYNATPLFTPLLSNLSVIGDPEEPHSGFLGVNPTGMALGSGSGGEIYLSDNGTDQNVKVYNLKGKLLRQIGKPGGRPRNGAWDSKGMIQPHGLALDKENKLWVVETNTFPRRHSVWDAKTGTLIRDFMGPCFYGADLGCFDTADHTRWIGGGALWKLDFDKKSATPVSTLYHQTKVGQMQTQIMGRYWNFDHRDGRTFLIGYGMGQSVYELRPDGSTKLWAFCGNLSSIAQNPRWTLPKAITDLPAVQKLFAINAEKARVKSTDTEPYGLWLDKVEVDQSLLRNISLLWVDRNGDDVGQPEEFEVMGEDDTMQTGGWGTGSPTISLNIPAKLGEKSVLLHLKPDGYLPSGAPNYSLAKAIASAVPVEPGLVGNESIQDRFGREIFNSSPMKAVGPDGRTLWSFPNRWVGVHGSHDAPLPQTGVMQGALYFLGTAPLDAQSEVTILNGNHGRFFVLTTDGLYLDEMFKDVRVTQNSDAYMIGGECFGGYFGKAEDGKYYLQSGHTDYRIFEIKGFDQLKRSQGNMDITPAQVLAAQANREARVVQDQKPKTITISDIPPFTNFSKDPNQWPGGPWMINWGNPQQPFPYAQFKGFRSGERLYLAYYVKDPSPWVNKGKDWTMLFKTGDSVDFQFSTDPNAKAGRTAAAPGDKRLLIAPFGDRSIAVLYSYREPGAASPMSFSSPWRAETVDRVTELKSAKIDVIPGEGQSAGTYTVVVSVPLADLGLPAAGKNADLIGDFGVIYGDSEGSMNLLRSYWSNQATGLVNDVPGEIMITPRLWGTLKFNTTPNP